MSTQNIVALKEAITQYETQLSQIAIAISSSSGKDREDLISLQCDIQELINLTEENLKEQNKLIEPVLQPVPETTQDDPFAEEYALFKAELADSEAANEVVSIEKDVAPVDIQSDLKELQGMKCQAPHRHQWGGCESFHNALVYSVESTEDVTNLSQIQVRVMFTNPTHKEMLPCPYFLEGECRFLEDQCRFSHGELVDLSCLKEYKEPDFSLIHVGSRVLVKQSDKLWHRAIISSISSDNQCQVKLESSQGKADVDLHDVLPMTNDEDDDETSTEELSEDEFELTEALVQQSLLVNPPSSALGGWEQHTKGFGSRLMAKMGYITGTGLGKHGEGRIEPVEAVVLPAGKSLDHCMLLREQSGGDQNLFKVERRMRRIQRKQQFKREKQLENSNHFSQTDVFDFINMTLGGKRGNAKEMPTFAQPASTEATSIKTETCKSLNVVGFKLSEEIRKAERELAQLQESISRHTQGSLPYKTMTSRVEDKQSELRLLRANLVSVDREQSQRKNKKKLSVF